MARFKLILIVLGGMLCYFGSQEWKLSSAASAQPQTITCEKLSKDGPGANAHVSLTDFLICDHSIVFEAEKNNPSRWNKIWVPVVPVDGEFVRMVRQMHTDGKLKENDPLPTPMDVRLIVKSSHVATEPELQELNRRPAIDGLIINTIESLGREEKQYLSESYPGIDFDKCFILDHDRKPAGGGKLAAMLGGGVLMVLLGVGWFAAGLKKG